ncbi:MAG TPA: alpha/beta hydrolase-fold protein [Acidimicrobiia bacterium]
MSRKRILQGVAAAGVASFVAGLTIVLAGAPSATADRPAAGPSSLSATAIPAADPTTTAAGADTSTTAAAPDTTTTAAPAPTTTTAPAPTTTTAAAPLPTTTTTGAPAAPTASGPGTVQLLELPSGDADGKTREVWVYRPAVADSADLPVVYFLHGYPGGDLDVNNIDLAGRLDQQFLAGAAPFVVAVPNGWSDVKNDTEWADSVDGEVRVESFIVSTAIPAVESANRRDAAHRAIAGFSMGGYGSANLAEHHPDLFGQLISIAGYYHIDDLSGMGAGSPAWEDAYSPDRHVGALAHTRTLLIVAAAESDPLIKGEGARFAAMARSAGQNPAFVVAPGNHTWSMVAGQIPATVAFLDAGW